jgi:hypothetical protein
MALEAKFLLDHERSDRRLEQAGEVKHSADFWQHVDQCDTDD